MHPADAFLLFLGTVLLPVAAVVAYLTHRQRMEEEAAEEHAQGTAAE